MAWYKYAKPGDKVVCVDDSSDWPIKPISKGVIYTISDVRCVRTKNAHGRYHTGVKIRLSEVPVLTSNCTELWVFPHRLRPIQPKSTETGMKVFKGILNGQRVPEVA